MVNHPAHYATNNAGIEVIDIIESTVPDFKSYCRGNVIKYVCRYDKKNGVEDLKKAQWYLERLISLEEQGAIQLTFDISKEDANL